MPTASRPGTPESSFGQKCSPALRRLARARTWWWGPLSSQTSSNASGACASAAFGLPARFCGPIVFGRSGHGSRGKIHSFPVCISEVYEGEGKTALSTLRNQAGEFRIFPRYHSSHPGRVVQRMLTRINVVFRGGKARAFSLAGQSHVTGSSSSLLAAFASSPRKRRKRDERERIWRKTYFMPPFPCGPQTLPPEAAG